MPKSGDNLLTHSSTFAELIAVLQNIATYRPSSYAEMKALEGEYLVLMQQIRDLGFGDTCPEEIWHYLSDADVRFKDPEYAKLQYLLFTSAIDAWARKPR